MAQHSRYWSCSKFADWIRGTSKPGVETPHGWRTWNQLAKQTHPLRYWLAEEGLDYIQDAITWPVRKIYDVKYYVNNRWVTRTHQLTAHPSNIAPGTWCDVGNRFLPCLFNELRDFVEVELAWWHIAWADKSVRDQYAAPFWATGWFRWRSWRCPKAGLDNLDWQMTLVNDYLSDDHPDRNQSSPQAERAREILALYTWWTEVYPNRPDPYEASGWSAICERRRKDGRDFFDIDDDDAEEHKERHAALDRCDKIEQQYRQEDEDMMIRLIKIRDSLWT
jgi:hypothetical protein